MNSGISKARPRCARARLSKHLQEQLLNAITIPSPVGTDFHQNAPVRSTKRHLDEIDQSPAKKLRLTNAQQPEVESSEPQLADKTPVLQHPKPNPPYASFLEKFVDPFQTGSRAFPRVCGTEYLFSAPIMLIRQRVQFQATGLVTPS
ncbi:hypothetical protein H9Q69_005526 [Fusarium xylarioides]|nr:hypothetical protein H9Q69_005526 [Fusarium xylarioides]